MGSQQNLQEVGQVGSIRNFSSSREDGAIPFKYLLQDFAPEMEARIPPYIVPWPRRIWITELSEFFVSTSELLKDIQRQSVKRQFTIIVQAKPRNTRIGNRLPFGMIGTITHRAAKLQSHQRITSTGTPTTTRDLFHPRIKIAKDEGINFQTHIIKALQLTQQRDGGSGRDHHSRRHGGKVMPGSVAVLRLLICGREFGQDSATPKLFAIQKSTVKHLRKGQ